MHPYMGSALFVNVTTLILTAISLRYRSLFYAPLLVRPSMLRSQSLTMFVFVDVGGDGSLYDVLTVDVLSIRKRSSLHHMRA